ncbi:MAG: hypothetical protein JW384_02439 [Nitrosomonadaceae bacterium]|nr:hypothetical protein [Nitrosomonadaceae bacterium]
MNITVNLIQFVVNLLDQNRHFLNNSSGRLKKIPVVIF